MKTFVKSTLLGVCLILASCVKQDLCNCGDGTQTDLNLILSFDTRFIDSINQNAGVRSGKIKVPHTMRIIVDAFTENDVSIKREIFNVDTVYEGQNYISLSMKMPSGKVSLDVWADYDNNGVCYDISDLDAVNFKEPYPTPETIGSIDAYSGTSEIDLSGGGVTSYVMEIESPFACYKILANDVKQFLQNNKTLEFVGTNSEYSMWIPTSYSAKKQASNYNTAGINFSSGISNYTDDEVVISSDYIFIDRAKSTKNDPAPDTHVTVSFVVKDEGKVIGGANLVVPLKRRHLTLVKDSYLTTSYKPEGIGVDENFKDSIIILLPDL